MPVDVLAVSPGESSAPALVGTERSWSYEELNRAVDERAESLRSAGLEAGSVAPIVARSDPAGVVSLLAHWRLGAVPAPLNPRLTGAEREQAVGSLTEAPPAAQCIVWTSGTAGKPRGVALTFDAFEASAAASARRLSLGPGDVWLVSLSVAHVGGLAMVTRSLLLGSSLVAMGAFEALDANEALEGRSLLAAGSPVSHVSLVPTQLLRLLEERRGAPAPSTLRCALIGGAHAPAELVSRAHRAGWPLALTYGATEMCSQIATADPELTRLKPGTAGPPLDGVEISLGPDGEILARGRTQAIGVGDEDGWYRTGDLGRIDEQGHLWVTGRRADRIVSGGVTIDAVEVEEAIRAHPSVIDVCVVGLIDPTWGERVAAWVEPVVGEFEETEVEEHLRGLLSPAKLPRLWLQGGELPRNATGKVDRGRVRERLEAL